MKRWTLAVVLLACVLALSACAKQKDPYEDIQNPVATITLSDGSRMRVELYPRYAPNTVANFIWLAENHKLDNREIFRVVSNVLIQTGDPNDNGTGDPGYYIQGEFSANGFEGNSLSHTRGTISMARKSDYDTGGSQFFIMEGSYPEYDGYYAAFGSIVDADSFTVLDQIGSSPVDGSYRPLDKLYVRTVTVETFDVDYPEPQKLDKSYVDNKEKKK